MPVSMRSLINMMAIDPRVCVRVAVCQSAHPSAAHLIIITNVFTIILNQP